MLYRTILLATDLAPESAATIDYAFALAERANAVVHTLHAVPSYPPHGGDEAQRTQVKLRVERALRDHLASPSMGKRLLDTREPIMAILQTATALSADLIVLSTHRRRGFERAMVGSVAQGVLDEAKVPVLVVSAP